MLDARSLSIVSVVIRLNMIVLFALVTSSHKQRYMNYFTGGLTGTALGFLLLSARGILGSFYTVMVANTLILLGAILFVLGIGILVKQEIKMNIVIAQLLIHTLLFLYFTYVYSSIMARIMIISVELSVVYGYASWMFFRDNVKRPHSVRLFVGLIYMFNSLYYVLRVYFTLKDGPQGDLFTDVYFLSLTLIATIIFMVSRSIGVLLCVMIDYDERLEQANKVLSELSTTDHLTNIKNLRSLMRVLERELERVKRYDRIFSIAMIDIDHFKLVNDKYGHTIGDEVLIGLAKTFKDELRKVDIIGRYGGEEFLLILPESTCRESANLLVRIAEKVKAHTWCVEDLEITYSAGVFEVNSSNCHATIKELVQQADELMYTAKRNGRDRVEHMCQGHDAFQ